MAVILCILFCVSMASDTVHAGNENQICMYHLSETGCKQLDLFQFSAKKTLKKLKSERNIMSESVLAKWIP